MKYESKTIDQLTQTTSSYLSTLIVIDDSRGTYGMQIGNLSTHYHPTSETIYKVDDNTISAIDGKLSAIKVNKLEIKQLDGTLEAMEIVLCSNAPQTGQYEDGKLYFIVEEQM